MPHPTFQVYAPGLLTTVQDLGRFGFRAQGVPPGGVMDPFAASIANLLVGNPPGDAVLEMTLIGPTLRVLRDTVIALCGADLSPTLDGLPLPIWHTAHLKEGQILRFGARQRGARAYLAVAGGIAVPPVLGSRSTMQRAGLGGLEGRALRAGDTLETYTENARPSVFGRGLRAEDIPRFPDHMPLRIILGPQHNLLTRHARDIFLSARFTVSLQSNRMGYRLEGPPLAVRTASANSQASEGVTYGTVQIAGGQALMLMADSQTTGGYPVAGVVIGADLCQAAQCVPGTTVGFQSVSVRDAQNLWREHQRFLRMLAGASGQ